VRKESEGHSTDEDGLCRFSDLPPDTCAGHWAGTGSPGTRASVAWSDLRGLSDHPSAVASRERNHRSMHGATRSGQPWTPDEDRFLRSWTGSFEEAARRLGRTCEGVHLRKVRLEQGLGYR